MQQNTDHHSDSEMDVFGLSGCNREVLYFTKICSLTCSVVVSCISICEHTSEYLPCMDGFQ